MEVHPSNSRTAFSVCSRGRVCLSSSFYEIGITPPEEFSDTVGLLQVLRLPSLLSLYTHNKSIFVYGIKRTAHSIRLSELRIPPQGCVEYTGSNDLY